MIFPYFEVAVRHGPNHGLHLSGELHLTIEESGALYGELIQPQGQSVNVTGWKDDSAIYLTFNDPERHTNSAPEFVLAVSALANSPYYCEQVLGGPLIQPISGSSGDWRGCLSLRSQHDTSLQQHYAYLMQSLTDWASAPSSLLIAYWTNAT